WTLDLNGAGLAAAMPYNVLVHTDSTLFADVHLGDGFVARGAAMPITLDLKDGSQPLVGTRAQVTGLLPDGASTGAIALVDDGAHADGAANDGVYGATLPPTNQTGVIRLVVEVSGTRAGGGAPFTRQIPSRLEVLTARGALSSAMTSGAVDANGDGLYDQL